MPKPRPDPAPVAARPTRLAVALAALIIAPQTILPAQAATVSWTDASGFWDVAGNWDPSLPGGTDDAVIDVAGTRTVTVRALGGPFAVRSLTVGGDDTLALIGSTLSLASASTVARLTHSGGTLTGTGDLLVTGPATLSAGLVGVMSGAATTTLRGTTTFGGYGLDAGRVLQNQGTANVGGSINLNRLADPGAGRLVNAAGALFDLRTFNSSIFATNQGAADNGSDARFDNAGTLRKSTSGGYTIAVPFFNTGTVETLAGSLHFNAGGRHGGALALGAGTTLGLGGGSNDLDAGLSVSGAGTLAVSGAVTVVNLNAPTTVASAFSQSGGTVRGGDLILTGPATLAVSSSLGVMSGPATTSLRGATTVGNFSLDAGRVLRNEATATVVGSINLNRLADPGAGRLVNVAGALFDLRTFNHSISATNQGAADDGLDAAFDNAGTLRKSTGGGGYTVAVRFGNTGTVDVQAGSLRFTGGGSQGGATTLAAGTTLGLDGGTHAIQSDASFTGAGTLAVNGAATVIDLQAPLSVASGFVQNGGTVRGGDLILNGPTDLSINNSLGVMSGPATTTLRGATTVGGGNGFFLDAGRILRNEAVATVVGSINLNRLADAGSGRLVNAAGALFDLRTFNNSIFATNHPGDGGGDARFDNAGTLRKSTGVGTYTIAVPLFNTGTVEVNAGRLALSQSFANAGTVAVVAGGTFAVTGTAFSNTGTLTGDGTFVAPAGGALLNAGTVAPGQSPGALTIEGDYDQTAEGLFEVELAAADDFDVLHVLGDASLAGVLRVIGLGGYRPAAGESFTVMTFDDGQNDAADLSGVFDTLQVTDFDPDIAFTVSYLDHAVVLNATAAPVPLPAAAVLFASGLLGLFGTARRRVGRVIVSDLVFNAPDDV